MSEVSLTAQTGRPQGSAASRRLRGEGTIPAVVYGLGKDPVAISVERGDLRRAMTTEAGTNALVLLSVDGAAPESTLVKEIQRHPVRREVTHVDFIRIDPERPMTLDVPIVLVGDTKKVTSAGGITEQRLAQLRVSVRPDSIPTQIDADVSNMVVDDVLSVGDLRLPDGVSTDVDPTKPVVTAQLTRAAIVAMRQAAKGEDAGPKGKKK